MRAHIDNHTYIHTYHLYKNCQYYCHSGATHHTTITIHLTNQTPISDVHSVITLLIIISIVGVTFTMIIIIITIVIIIIIMIVIPATYI